MTAHAKSTSILWPVWRVVKSIVTGDEFVFFLGISRLSMWYYIKHAPLCCHKEVVRIIENKQALGGEDTLKLSFER